MVNFCGQDVYSVSDIVASFRANPTQARGTYRVRYRFGGPYDHDPYHGAQLQRPPAFAGNESGAYPWEQLLVAAVQCAGSDYPMLAQHWGIPLEAVDVELEAVFDPRGEFSGLTPDFPGIPEAPNCFQAFRWKATLTSSAGREALEQVHRRVLSHNMVLNALRAVPLTSQLTVQTPRRQVAAAR